MKIVDPMPNFLSCDDSRVQLFPIVRQKAFYCIILTPKLHNWKTFELIFMAKIHIESFA